MIRQLLPEPRDLVSDADLEDVYLHPTDRHLRADFVASLDGVIELDGRSKALGGPADRSAFLAMRAVTDVVLVGAGTIRKENYGPVNMDESVRDRRQARGQAPVPSLAIVSRRADLDPHAKVFSGSDRPLLLTTARGMAERHDLVDIVDVMICGDDDVDLHVAVTALNERSLGRICCEGGPSLLKTLLQAGLVDELALTHSPCLAGLEHIHLTSDATFDPPLELRLTGLLEGDGLLLGRYAFE